MSQNELEYKPIPNIINVDDINKILQENKQLKSILTELEEYLIKITKNGANIEKLTCSNILVYLKELKEKYKLQELQAINKQVEELRWK